MRAGFAVSAVLLLSWSPVATARELTPPSRLPGKAASSSTDKWLLGVRDLRQASRVLLDHNVTFVGDAAVQVPRSAARGIARRLAAKGLLTYAEPDVRASRLSLESAPDSWGRGAVVSSGLSAPFGDEIAVIDSFVDATHPDLAGHVRYLNSTESSRIDDAHGTQVASVASASANGTGILGVLPGARVASIGLEGAISCADVAEAIYRARDAEVPILNLSLGTAQHCFTLYVAVQRAFGGGSLVIAAAGNEFDAGNPVVYPAAYPHVVSVAAVSPDGSSSYFSTANAAVDVAAPGEKVPTAVPEVFDSEDGTVDGYSFADGTSFAAPMVAGAASWIWAARTALNAGQVADVIRYSATDLGPQGWDQDYGWGMLNLDAALQEPTPPVDPGEPNDDLAMVNGTVFRGADRPVWKGLGRRTIFASADVVEDPVDVYRLRLPARSEVSVAIDPRFGDPDLEIFDASAVSFLSGKGRVCRSRQAAGATDSCTILWRGRRARTAYVVVRALDSNDGYFTEYRLKLKRLGRS